MTIGGATGQSSGCCRFVAGSIATGTITRRRRSVGTLGRVIAIGSTLAFYATLIGVALSLRTTIGVTSGRAAVVDIGIAVLLLSRTYSTFRIVTNDVVPRRLFFFFREGATCPKGIGTHIIERLFFVFISFFFFFFLLEVYFFFFCKSDIYIWLNFCFRVNSSELSMYYQMMVTGYITEC